jgi:DnaJ-class molecular chaperone
MSCQHNFKGIVCPACKGKKGFMEYTSEDCNVDTMAWEECWTCNGAGEILKCKKCDIEEPLTSIFK